MVKTLTWWRLERVYKLLVKLYWNVPNLANNRRPNPVTTRQLIQEAQEKISLLFIMLSHPENYEEVDKMPGGRR